MVDLLAYFFMANLFGLGSAAYISDKVLNSPKAIERRRARRKEAAKCG